MTNKELQNLLSYFPGDSIVKVACDGIARDFKDEAGIKGNVLILVADDCGNPYHTFGRRADAGNEPIVDRERLAKFKESIKQIIL